MGKSYSPLRYPGGKGKFYKYLIPIFTRNKMTNITYVEPFAGGSGLACELLIKKQVDRIILNDYDRSIFAFWYSILNNTNDFCNKILNTEITLKERTIQKNIQLNKNTANLLDLGFSTFFLNRTNRSGIIKGGPISTNEYEGKYPLNCRFNKQSLIEIIKKIAAERDNIELYNLDALDLIKMLRNSDPNNFIFFDPPYYHNGKDLYVNFYKHDDHIKLCNNILNNLSNHRWILTYDDCPEIKEIYKNAKKDSSVNFKKKTYTLSYTAGKARKATELIYYNNLVIPK